MPTYQDPRHGVSQSYAQMEAASIAPITRAMLSAFDLYHPLSGHHYFVADNANLFATLEATALEHAGEEVEHLAAPVLINEPDESDSAATPEISLSVDNISGAWAARMELTRGSLVPWTLTERVYASDDTSGPAYLPPQVVELSSAEIHGATLIMKASFGNPVNVNVPRLTIKRAEYPGLVR